VGSTAPAAPTPHPAGRSDSRRRPAGKSDGAPPSTSRSPAVNPVAGHIMTSGVTPGLLGQAPKSECFIVARYCQATD
jgi:hypothetical protein